MRCFGSTPANSGHVTTPTAAPTFPRGATTILTENYGPPINQYAFEHKKKLKATILKVVEWDRRTPHKYDHRWINLHEMGAVIDALDAEDGRRNVAAAHESSERPVE